RGRAVHPCHVVGSGSICGHVHFARPQREPANCCSATHCNSYSEVGATHEGDQRRSINRLSFHRAWYPTPRPACIGPASVMKGRIAPRRIIHPCPAPWCNPGPVAIMIGCPADRHCGRHPNLSVLRVVAPDAVLVEILVANHLRRHVSCRTGALFAAVALLAPIVEIVAFASVHSVYIGREGVSPSERSSLTGFDPIGTTVATGLPLAFRHHDDRAVSVFAGLQAISAGPHNRKGLIRRIHFENFISFKAPHANAEGA